MGYFDQNIASDFQHGKVQQFFMRTDITILGAGSWGTAMAQCFAQNGHGIKLWHRNHKVAHKIQTTRINHKYFPQHRLHDNIEVVSDWHQSIEHAQIIILAIPTSTLSYFLRYIFSNIHDDQVVLNASKGLDHQQQRTISQWIENQISTVVMQKHYGVLSGPSFASEVMEQNPLASC
ncbi:MAG: 2-dehydropantoate 2-reductase N-terminal domain-containing protein [Bdellovibrionota bacterium]